MIPYIVSKPSITVISFSTDLFIKYLFAYAWRDAYLLREMIYSSFLRHLLNSAVSNMFRISIVDKKMWINSKRHMLHNSKTFYSFLGVLRCQLSNLVCGISSRFIIDKYWFLIFIKHNSVTVFFNAFMKSASFSISYALLFPLNVVPWNKDVIDYIRTSVS